MMHPGFTACPFWELLHVATCVYDFDVSEHMFAVRNLATAFFADSLYSDTLFPLRFFIPSWSLAYELYYYVAFIAILVWPRLVLPLFATSIAVGRVIAYFLRATPVTMTPASHMQKKEKACSAALAVSEPGVTK